MSTSWSRVLLLLLLASLLTGTASAQSLRKLEHRAINRSRITLVNGDTVQRFTTTRRRPRPRADRFYYWQDQDHVLRTVGAYNGYLLSGPYQLTDRADHLLRAGTLTKGVKTGTWRQWRPDGSLVSASHWRRGRQRGPTITYDANSQPLPVVKAPKIKVKTPAATVAGEPRAARWWQPTYWKGKVKLRKKATPAPGSSPVVSPPVAPKKRAVKPAPTPAPPVPKTTGS